MQITANEVKPVPPVYLKDPLGMDQGRSGESFQQILDRKLERKISTVPKKVRTEFTGVLNPCNISFGGTRVCHFELSTEDSDLLLQTEGHLIATAKKYLWDEVRVRGFFDETGTVLCVESIISIHIDDEVPLYINDLDWEIERFKKRILKERSIEPSIEHLVMSGNF